MIDCALLLPVYMYTADVILAAKCLFQLFFKCVNINMRRTFGENKTFKGSVFAEFETKEEANAFVARKDLKYKDNELICMTKYVIICDYFSHYPGVGWS
jgi:hypothetical protein